MGDGQVEAGRKRTQRLNRGRRGWKIAGWPGVRSGWLAPAGTVKPPANLGGRLAPTHPCPPGQCMAMVGAVGFSLAATGASVG